MDSRLLLRKHIEEEHKEKETHHNQSELAQENAKLKEELRALKDNYERLSDIFNKQQEDFNSQKLIIEVDIPKTREGFRQLKAENEELKVRNDTLFKLGDVALKKYEKNEKHPNTKTKEDAIEVVGTDDVIIDSDDLQVLAKNKAKGFRRSDPTAPAEVPLYSDVVQAPRGQAGHAARQQHPPQAPEHYQTLRSQRPQQVPQNSSKDATKYCHYFNNGTCHFEEKYARKCIFLHKKAPICSYDEKCNRKKCMFSHVKKHQNRNTEHFLGQTPQNTTLQEIIQQVLGTVLKNQEKPQQIPVWQNNPWQRRNYQ